MSEDILSIEEIKQRITPICKSYDIKRAFLFGSYSKGLATPQSDVDLRIDWGNRRSIELGVFYEDIAKALGRSVDILTTRQLPKDFLDDIKKDEVILYGNKG